MYRKGKSRKGIGLISPEVLRRKGKNRYRIPMKKGSTCDGRRPRLEKEEPPLPVEPDITIIDVDLLEASNSSAHRTTEYDLPDDDHLIVRRGQPFDITIELSREFDPDKDDLKLVFAAGENADEAKGTLIKLILSDKDEENKWGAWIVEKEGKKKEGKKITVRINTPPTCYVGKWKFSIETIQKSDEDNIIFDFDNDQNIFILFNPWCKDDQVYYPIPAELDEYVMNDTGKIYVGSVRRISARRWVFGQFEQYAFESAMYLLDTYITKWSIRGDPVKVARRLSQIVNDGLLIGNWSGDYADGKSPLHWTGSAAILEEYFKTKSPVCFGQCWVFSGLMTTLCRTLGIPARSVTNFASAHDCDGSITIDSHFGPDDEPCEELNDDSVWNFHVWNDMWCARPDLPFGNGGWQAVDATPQELSDGKYQCGPAPLEAIKRGEVYLPFDCPFVFAEVNADRIYWSVDENGDKKKVGMNAKSIGKYISTKLPKGKTQEVRWEVFCWDRDREDITDQYKFKEDTDAERAAVLRANQESSKQGLYHKQETQDVKFELVDKENILLGTDIEVIVKMHNTSDEVRTVSGSLCTTSMYYTGCAAAKVKSMRIEEKIQPNSKKEVKMTVPYNEYEDKLVDHCHIMMSCMCRVAETNFTYVDKDPFTLIKPELTIKAPKKVKVGTKTQIGISFTNPLPYDLTGCTLTIDGPGGLQKSVDLNEGTVPSKQTFMRSIEIVPKKPGQKTLVVAFNAKQMEIVEGTCDITVDE